MVSVLVFHPPWHMALMTRYLNSYISKGILVSLKNVKTLEKPHINQSKEGYYIFIIPQRSFHLDNSQQQTHPVLSRLVNSNNKNGILCFSCANSQRFLRITVALPTLGSHKNTREYLLACHRA